MEKQGGLLLEQTDAAQKTTGIIQKIYATDKKQLNMYWENTAGTRCSIGLVLTCSFLKNICKSNE